jgi:sortase A
VPEILFTTRSRRQERFRRPQRPSRSRRALRALGVMLIAIGFLALLDAGVTLVWQEPISALIAQLEQDHLSAALRKVEHAVPSPGERLVLASIPDEQKRISYLARVLRRQTPEGGPVGRIVIPRIGADFVIVKGTGTEDLQSGPGIYPDTSFPGVPGTTAIAGHRTTYLAPFRHIDELRSGSQILLEMPYAHLTYAVIGQRVVEPTDVAAAVDRVGYTRLVLSACTPLFSAAKRILVYARLTETVPVGAARRLPGGAVARPFVVSARAPSSSRVLPAVLKPFQTHVLPPFS